MLLFGVFLLVGLADANKCTNESVHICIQNMKAFKLREYEAIVPTWTETELTDLCSEYTKTDACIDELIDDCSAYDRFYYAAAEDSWNYICVDKRAEYLQYRDCLSTPELHSQANDHCTKVWEKRVENLNHDKFRLGTGALNQDGFASLCNYATSYLECVYTEVGNFCPKEAATWQRNFDETLTQPILKLVGCQALTKDGKVVYVSPDGAPAQGLSDKAIIIIAVSIALGVLVMVIIAILLLRQSKKSKPRDRDQAYHDPVYHEPGPYVVYSPEAAGGPVMFPPTPPAYKEKDDLGTEFGIPMPPPPESTYGAPPLYVPSEAPGDDGRSVASGHTTRSHRSNHSKSNKK